MFDKSLLNTPFFVHWTYFWQSIGCAYLPWRGHDHPSTMLHPVLVSVLPPLFLLNSPLSLIAKTLSTWLRTAFWMPLAAPERAPPPPPPPPPLLPPLLPPLRALGDLNGLIAAVTFCKARDKLLRIFWTGGYRTFFFSTAFCLFLLQKMKWMDKY